MVGAGRVGRVAGHAPGQAGSLKVAGAHAGQQSFELADARSLQRQLAPQALRLRLGFLAACAALAQLPVKRRQLPLRRLSLPFNVEARLRHAV